MTQALTVLVLVLTIKVMREVLMEQVMAVQAVAVQVRVAVQLAVTQVELVATALPFLFQELQLTTAVAVVVVVSQQMARLVEQQVPTLLRLPQTQVAVVVVQHNARLHKA